MPAHSRRLLIESPAIAHNAGVPAPLTVEIVSMAGASADRIARPSVVMSSVRRRADRASVTRPWCVISRVTASNAGSIAVPVSTSDCNDAATNTDEMEYQRTVPSTLSPAGPYIRAARSRSLRSHSGSVSTVASGTIPAYVAGSGEPGRGCTMYVVGE